MGTRADEVRREIEDTRADLGDKLDAIGDRVSPKRIVQRRTERVREGIRNVRTSVMGDPNSPETGAVGSAKDSAGQIAGRASQKASDIADQVRDAPQAVARTAKGNPLAAGLIAFGGGLLLSSLLPPSDTERKAAEKLAEQIEPVKRGAIEAGRNVVSQLQESAKEKADAVKEVAADAASTVKEEAESSAARVQKQAKKATQRSTTQAKQAKTQVKRQARSAAPASRSGATSTTTTRTRPLTARTR